MTRAAFAVLLVGMLGRTASAQTPFDPPRPRTAARAEVAAAEVAVEPAPPSPVAAPGDLGRWTNDEMIDETIDDLERSPGDLRGIYGLADPYAARPWCIYRGTLRHDRALVAPYRR